MKSSGKHILKQAPLKKTVQIKRVKIKEPDPEISIRHKDKPKHIRVISGIAVGLLIGLGILLIVSLKYSFVSVNLAGYPISQNQNKEELKNKIQAEAEKYKIYIKSPKAKKAFSLEKTGVSINIDRSIDNAINAKMPNNLFRRLAFWSSVNVPLDLTANQKEFDKFINNNLIKTIKKTKDASVKVVDGVAVITPEKSGLAYTVDDPRAMLLDHISKLNQGSITLIKSTVPAKVTKNEAKQAKETVDKFLAKDVSFDIAGTNIKASANDIGKWLEISPISKNKTIDVVINSGKVLEYLDAIAAPYVSPPQNAIVLPKSSRVLVAGQNGVDIVNKEALATEIAKQMLVKNKINQTLSVQYQTYKTVTATPHDKWIAIDLTSKVLYVYEKTNLVGSFPISAGAPQTPTVEGTYKIYSKIASQDMAGPNADGTRYFQPAVPYVNYFYADYAIHGVYWRPDSYLGNINASHGCVGMNVGSSAWIYNWAPIGTTVITFS